MFKDLLKYEELQEASEEGFGFGKVEILRSFGPLSEGQKLGLIWFDLETSICQVFNDEGTTELCRFPFKLTA